MQTVRFTGLIVLRPDLTEVDFQSMLRSLTQDAKSAIRGQWTANYEKVLRTKEKTKECYVSRVGPVVDLDTYWYEIVAVVEDKDVSRAERFMCKNCPTCNPEAYPVDAEVLWVSAERVSYLRHLVRKIDGKPLIP